MSATRLQSAETLRQRAFRATVNAHQIDRGHGQAILQRGIDDPACALREHGSVRNGVQLAIVASGARHLDLDPRTGKKADREQIANHRQHSGCRYRKKNAKEDCENTSESARLSNSELHALIQTEGMMRAAGSARQRVAVLLMAMRRLPHRSAAAAAVRSFAGYYRHQYCTDLLG